MKITSVTLQNFRCFGTDPVTIDLVDSTVLVGANGAGKSAALEALVRLFGSASQRRLVRSDFHLPADEAAEDIEETTLSIEARLDFPELEENGDGNAVPECFNQMTISGTDGTPYCRVRLEATWRRTSTPEGEIDEPIYWIKTDAAEPAVDDKAPMLPFDRSRIQVIYVPAARDPVRQMRHVTGSLLYRLLRAIKWSDAVRDAVQEASEQLRTAFQGEAGVAEIEQAIVNAWRSLHEFRAYSEVGVQPVGGRFEDLLRKVEVSFRPGEGGVEQGVDRLSDGLKSLFYFSLVGATFDIEQTARAGGKDEAAILADELRLPTLTVFAIEEAENHLSPHYLGRILNLLRRIANSPNAQVVLTSQSPAILARIDPESVRHFRLDPESQTTIVKSILLPSREDAGEAYKFVKEAVRAFPELYFASLVVLGEGDSEEIVLPRVATAANLPVDTSFVSVVPLGGRHVNHFWRLLNDLSIPFVTLLDLDRERHGGGWARVKYACTQLIKNGVAKNQVLRVEDGVLSDVEFAKMHTWNLRQEDVAELKAWTEELEEFDVFFSDRLDLDFLMLMAFPDAYHRASTGVSPKIPAEGSPEYNTRLKEARIATLKPKGSDGSTYSADEKAEFIWYSYLFLGRGKPATHILALNELTDEQLREGTPPVLQRLIARMREKLGREDEE